MLNIQVDMGKLHCGMQTQQWNKGIVKNVTQNRASQSCNNIPLWSLDFFIFNVMTQSLLKMNKDRYLTNKYSYIADFTDLDAVYGSDDGLKRKKGKTFFDLSWKMIEPTNYETDYRLLIWTYDEPNSHPSGKANFMV